METLSVLALFVNEIHRSDVDSQHKAPVMGIFGVIFDNTCDE